METKEYNPPVQEEARPASDPAELAQPRPAAAPAPRAFAVRSRARRQALLDAGVGLVQQALVCPALAACVCAQGRLALSFEFIAAAVLTAAVDFFFGGFFSRKYRPLYNGGLLLVLCCIPAIFQAGILGAGLTLLLGALAQAALYAANSRLALTMEQASYKTMAARILAAAVLAMAFAGMGTLA